ncbi:cytoskeleton-associated protein 4 [Trichomycterus rosablanca]|uniref:cytoskeleton-associated protein 4 n=1 Tax=Trichomycterus rosablanca TaxID=2290929 RepID=UPI002F3575B0
MAKNKSKIPNSNDKAPVTPQDDVAKKIPKVSKSESCANSRSASGKLSAFISALCYFILVSGAAIASFYLQRVLNEVNQIRLESEESLQKNSQLVHKVETALQQVTSMKSSLDSLEVTVGRAQAKLDNTNLAVQKGEAEIRRVEEVLQKLQNEILHDLSEGIREVKQAREHDFSSLERTLEERLAELSRSIADSVAEFTGAQGEAQAQLSKLKAQLEEHSEPGNLKDELTAITTAVAQLHTANEVADGNVGVLREQIASVGSELQTRNKEVASLSEEIETIRSLVQSTAGLLRQKVSAVQVSMQAVSDQVQSLQDGQETTSKALQSLETDLREELAKTEKKEDDLEARLKATEESAEALKSSAAEQMRRVEVLLSKYDSHESSLASQSQVATKARQALREEMDGLRGSVEDLQISLSSLAATNSRLEEMRMEALGEESLEENVEMVEEQAETEYIGEEEAETEELVEEEATTGEPLVQTEEEESSNVNDKTVPEEIVEVEVAFEKDVVEEERQ